MVNGINYLQHIAIESVVSHLKGLGHAMLDNSSPDQLAIKLTKNIKIKVPIKTNTKKANKIHGWAKLEKVKVDSIPTSAQLFSGLSTNFDESVIYDVQKSSLVVIWPWYRQKKKALPIWILDLINVKIKQNTVKYRHLPTLNWFLCFTLL